MIARRSCATPLGNALLCAEEDALTGLYFFGQKHFPHEAAQAFEAHPVLLRAEALLARHFAGEAVAPDFPLKPSGTPFQAEVWRALQTIPRGQTRTYAQIAAQIGRPTATRAVGAAVGRNPISIWIPCHRVIGANGALTGYAGGLDRKRALLALEGSHFN